MDSEIDAAGLALADPEVYTDEHSLHEALTLLRKQAPVHWVDPPGYRPFWAITKHCDVMTIGRLNSQFLNAPRPTLTTIPVEQLAARCQSKFRTLIHMDDPDHRMVRSVGMKLFRLRALESLRTRVSEIAKQYVDRMVELDGACDFVEVAKQFPLHVILSILGLPRSDHQRILTLTQDMRGSDPEKFVSSQEDLFDYFRWVVKDRICSPKDDLASSIANARVNGERLPEHDIAAYYVSLATAGHDTLSVVLSGGLRALVENADQSRQLQRNPELMPRAVDEMIRWVTPTKSFMRTATDDYELRGVTISAGESVLLNYASANRDEDVFADPFVFDIDRVSNHHLAFGFGAHYCLGASLAKMEVGVFFLELLTRLRSVKLAGQPVLAASTFVGGLKELPIEYELSS